MTTLRVQVTFEVEIVDETALRDAAFHAYRQMSDRTPGGGNYSDPAIPDAGTAMEKLSETNEAALTVLAAEWFVAHPPQLAGIAQSTFRQATIVR